MRKSLLDTSILIAFLKGEKKVFTKVEEYSTNLMNSVSVSYRIIKFFED